MNAVILAGARSLAVNLGLAIAALAGLAVGKIVLDTPSPAHRRSKFLTQLGREPGVPTDLFCMLHGADDPIGDAYAMLGGGTEPGIETALRAALTAAA